MTDPLRISWLGHATVLIEVDGVRVLTDPVLRDRIGPLVRIGPKLRPRAVGAVDCVVLSHLHADHADLKTLRSLVRSGPMFVPHGAGRWLRSTGLDDVTELLPGQEAAVGGVKIAATPATHEGRRRPLGGPRADPVGFVISGHASTYFAGDTDLFEEMSDLNGRIDVALLPVWGWGPTLGPGHLDPRRAARAAALIAPTIAIPIHWGTFALGRPARRPVDIERPAREFAALTNREARDVEVRILAPGGQTTVAAS